MIASQLINRFPHQWDLLQSMYPDHHFTTERIQRLDEIFTFAEKRWEQNLQRLIGKKVKYLLIPEAPPWTETGEVRYFYSTCDGAWVNRVWKAFFDSQKPTDSEQALELFAGEGFLLVDSLPFAENYSRRRGRRYRQLVISCSQYLVEKLTDRRIEWGDDVRVALAFKINGQAVIDGFPDGISVPTGQRIHLSEDLICADGSGYTNPRKLREAFELP
jgi:hypothetical protein